MESFILTALIFLMIVMTLSLWHLWERIVILERHAAEPTQHHRHAPES